MPYKDPLKAKKESAKRWNSWAKRNPEKANARMRNWRQRNPSYMMLHRAKIRAEQDGSPFSITKEDIPAVPAMCPIACIPIFVRNEGKQGPCDNSPTLDRVDPIKGYIPGNIRIISFKGNRWKSNMTKDDVRRLLNYMEN